MQVTRFSNPASFAVVLVSFPLSYKGRSVCEGNMTTGDEESGGREVRRGEKKFL